MSRRDRLRVLLLADDCNPDWPSLPIVGFNYARAIAARCDVTVATQVRNRPNISRRGPMPGIAFEYLDTEAVARPIHRLSTFLRGGEQVAWSTGMILNYLPYLAFERAALRAFRDRLRAGTFDVVHRITPMSPTLPSYAAGRTGTPFVIGPLNGGLAWPKAFAAEMTREREGARRLRGLHRHLPFARATYARADAILAAFAHTRAEVDPRHAAKTIDFPEVGYDEAVFHPPAAPRGEGPARFLFVGRLVPYKLPEVAVRAFAASEALRGCTLHLVGDGPERERLAAMIRELGAEDRIFLEGRTDQAGVADWMRRCDVFVFPSIRELGAGVVVEAMASGMACIGADYGAPGELLAAERGLCVPLGPLATMTDGFRAAMEALAADPAHRARLAARAERHVHDRLRWSAKAEATEAVYRWALDPVGPAPAPFAEGAPALRAAESASAESVSAEFPSAEFPSDAPAPASARREGAA